MYYRPTKAAPKVRPELAGPIKALIEEEPSFGYRTVARLLGMNKNTVQRVFQLKGWQVRKRGDRHAPKNCPPWQRPPTSVGPPIYAEYGPDATAGQPGIGHRLLHAATAGLTVLTHRQGQHGRRRT